MHTMALPDSSQTFRAAAGFHKAGLEQNLQNIIKDLVINGSIEIRHRFTESVVQAREVLPYGMRIYIRSLHEQSVAASLDRISALHAAGFDPVPHIAARRIRSRPELLEFLTAAVRDYGVSRVLLIGGDITDTLGPYADASALLRDGVLVEGGIREVGLAGYPEGHAHIPKSRINHILQEKLRLAGELGLGTYLLTQFSFIPARVVEFCASMSRLCPQATIYVGIAGPADPLLLANYAKICGVSDSIRALTTQGFEAARAVSDTDPRAQLEAVARYCATRESCNVMGIHVYSFGGFIKSSQWMHQLYSK